MPDAIDALALPAEPDVWTPPPWPKDCPEPGIYTAEQISFPDYVKIPAMNASTLKVGLAASALRMKAVLDGRLQSDSPARKFGRALHCRLLEPAEYKTRFQFAEPCGAILKKPSPRAGQPCGKDSKYAVLWEVDAKAIATDDCDPSYTGHDWYCGTHRPDAAEEPTDYVSEKKAGQIERIADSVFTHVVVALLRAHGGCEVTIIWEKDGYPAKCRIDKLIHGGNCPTTALDLKTIQSGAGSEPDLLKQVRKWYYDLSAAWYIEGVTAAIGAENMPNRKANFVWCFCEGDEPYDIAAKPASVELLEIGRMKVTRAWNMYLRGVRENVWPGYSEGLEELFPAAWEAKQYGVAN